MTIAYAALVDGPPEAIAADAVHGESQLASIADANPGAFQRIFIARGLMEAGAPAVPVAEVAMEVSAVPDPRRWATAWWTYFHLEDQCIRASPACRDMLGSAVADATRRSTESSESYRQLCHAAMLRLRAFSRRAQHGQGHSGSTRGGATLAGSGCS